MAHFDLPLDELRSYLPERNEPDDFDAFWTRTLDEAQSHPLDARFEPAGPRLATVETFDVTFAGYGGQPIKAWLLLPRQRSGPLPCIVETIGYGGGRGHAFDWLFWASAGYAHFVMDTRGQGSVWRHGDTPDRHDGDANPQHPGFLTRGVLDPDSYYYRRLMTDAVRAVEAARSHPDVDADRVAVTGVSQGGGLTLALAGLVPDVAFAMPDVPFLCHWRRAITVVDGGSYGELRRFLQNHRHREAEVFATLAYFDGVNFAARATADALFSVALMDVKCPPSTVFAAYNHYAGAKRIRVYPFNDHEGGESFQRLEQLAFARERFGA